MYHHLKPELDECPPFEDNRLPVQAMGDEYWTARQAEQDARSRAEAAYRAEMADFATQRMEMVRRLQERRRWPR